MRFFVTRLFSRWLARSRRHLVEDSLALHRRGEVRSDGLQLTRMQSRMEVEWRARDIHPWDRELPAERQRDLFVRQVLSDIDAALGRLFSALPEVEALDVRVLDPHSAEMIVSGLVFRSSLSACRPRSNRMWLSQLGLEFRLRDNHFETLKFPKTA